MPLVRISLQAGKPEPYRTAISNEVYQAMRQTLDIPDGDRFQVITEHSGGQLVADPHFMGMNRSADFVLIQIFLSRGRTTAIKQALYRSIAERLAISPGIQADDVMIVLTEVGLDDWSFGRGKLSMYFILRVGQRIRKNSPPDRGVGNTVVVGSSNAVTSPVHDRMPVILDPDGHDLWLDPGMKDVSAASELLKPCDARLMRCFPVSVRNNRVANDDE